MIAATDLQIERLTSAAENIPSVRQVIFELAISGRLVPPSAQWIDVALSEVVYVRGGSTPSMARQEFWGGDVPWVSPKDMHSGEIVGSEMLVTRVALEQTSLELVPVGSILIVGRSGILKRKLPVQITRVPCTVNQDIKALTPSVRIDSAYLRLWFLGAERVILAEDVKTGTTVQSLVYSKLFARRMALPTLAEQRRIVAKVDELMALCDRLETQQQGADSAHVQLVQALLDSLTQARDADDFRASWGRLVGHFHGLFTTSESVDALASAILQLAVTGRLVNQRDSDEPATDLLKRLDEDARRFCVLLKAPRSEVSPIKQDEVPVGLPIGWTWARLGSIFRVITDGDHQAPPQTQEGIAFLTIGNVTDGYLNFEQCRRVDPAYFDSLAAYRKPGCGDLLYTVVGATYGRPVPVDTDLQFCVQRHIAILKRSDYLNPLFAYFGERDRSFRSIVTDGWTLDVEPVSVS